MNKSTRTRKVRHFCVKCNRDFPHTYESFCPCGGMIDIEYDLENARLHDSDEVFERYFDLLPTCDRENMLPVGLKLSPTRRAEKLGSALGLERLYIKNETVHPTCSTKDRMGIAVHSFFKEVGIKRFAASSTGNSSTALAHYAQFVPDVRVYIHMAEDFLHRLQFEENDHVKVFCLRGATFVEACNESRAFAERNGITSERGFFNPARREGLKTAFMEAAEAVSEPIDWYVQAVSSAMGVYGVYKGAKELRAIGRIKQVPRLLCVQQETCMPMVKAYDEGATEIQPHHIFPKPTGIASSILRGNPTRVYPYVLSMLNESNGTMQSVSESEIREARAMVHELEGVDCCFTASVAVAGLKKAVRRGGVPRGDAILVSLTGADRPSSPPLQKVCYLSRVGDSGWEPESAKDKEYLDAWEVKT